MAEHIEKRLLNTNLRYRFDYVSKFLNFTTDDIAVLNSFAKIAQPQIPSLVDTIYQKLFEYDITKNYFLKQNFGFKGIIATDESQLTLQSEQMLLRIDSIRKYLYRILRQHNQAYPDVPHLPYRWNHVYFVVLRLVYRQNHAYLDVPHLPHRWSHAYLVVLRLPHRWSHAYLVVLRLVYRQNQAYPDVPHLPYRWNHAYLVVLRLVYRQNHAYLDVPHLPYR
ncbi:unnamed protein product [Rotaria sp. Silwood2]|nr:unnamed protein product [Rotaria sp. Silwood2]CAF2925702.1 unnamed protein product [Rotaria sp. Silwood2]CAF3976652.1 unnamed protein product [Rotaria sp. Silwood2]CAF4201119.1 unnamed protein product [Rotaria sp. Silwood2]